MTSLMPVLNDWIIRLSTTLPSSERDSLKLVDFHQWFTAAVSRWLDIALYKALIRIGKAIALDNLTPVDPLAKHSSSAVDTVAVFYQVTISTGGAGVK